jgi:3-isopropylmalate/(R)-2-methylmalate dehydratase large subunit
MHFSHCGHEKNIYMKQGVTVLFHSSSQIDTLKIQRGHCSYMASTLFSKLWNDHVITEIDERTALLQVDRHIVHEVSSAGAFQLLSQTQRGVVAPHQTFATQDHILSTQPGRTETTYAGGTEFVRFLRNNCARHGIELFDVHDPRQGIVHVVAAELGLALPGCSVVCGDSHTATLGAFGALAWGVGTSEVAHVLATQTLAQAKPATMEICVEGVLPVGVEAKDIILAILGNFGVMCGVGYAVEYRGSAIRALSMEGRMTICNMSIELGARFGMIAPDQKTFDYLAGRHYTPKKLTWDAAVESWRGLVSDADAVFDKRLTLDITNLKPQISWGTTPGDVVGIDQAVPLESSVPEARRPAFNAALKYMGLNPGQKLHGTPVDVVFIGSCTNSRLSDLQAAADVIRGRRVAPNVRALVVPGSAKVREAAQALGLDQIFKNAGFEWREAGCSMCLALNDDVVDSGARCVSTSNRNFEGRQGPGARTHLASPRTAAASALAGCITDTF